LPQQLAWTRVNCGSSFYKPHTICRPKSALFGANSWAYLKYVSSYSIFCVYISKLSLLWQQGFIWVIFRLHRQNGQPRKHPTEKESLTCYLCYKPCCGQFCVSFRYCVNKGWPSKR